MKRNYTKAYYLNRIEKLKAKIKDITFSTDIIIGFPTETEEDFQHTLDVVQTLSLSKCFLSNIQNAQIHLHTIWKMI
jgi:2-methylthioadenine synthetase